MSSNSQTQVDLIFQTEPFLTKQEVSLVIMKTGKNLDKKILQYLGNNTLLPLKKGLYMPQTYLTRAPYYIREYIANILYSPSYLSLDYVLSREGIIPESVFTYTSVSTKSTRIFFNNLGRYSYQTIKPLLLTGYSTLPLSSDLSVKIATRAKALFDLLYLKPFSKSIKLKRLEFDDLRLNTSALTPDDIREFSGYVKLSQSKKMEQIYRMLLESSN